MEFNDQGEHDEEMASYDSLGNSVSSVKIANLEALAQQNRKLRYRECLKNHAVGICGHALDGCGEFMPGGAEGTLDGLKCAACNCHRNFHRKETEGGIGVGEHFLLAQHPHLQFSPHYRTPAGNLHVDHHQSLLALSSASGGGGIHSREVQEDIPNPNDGHGGGRSRGFGKKRYRSKFSQDQKERLLDLAERVGWRIQKDDEAIVRQFCNQTGVKRQVLKVWMHNNKHTLGKKNP